jgi:hypothetical protein
MEKKPRTLAQIQQTIKNAKDSVWVINNEIEKLAAGEAASASRKDNIFRNVEHLKIVVGNQEIIDSGEDISELQTGISVGEAKLSEPIWPAEETTEEDL